MSLIGRRLGLYQIDSLLGAGGMGEVYKARDTRLGRDVAIKILPAAFVSDRERLARFEREARLLASLNHSNVAQIYGLEGQPPFIVMELVPGDTLADRIHHPGQKVERLAVADALKIARQIIDALEAAHERGIVHRDLKPANVKITADGVVKVLDFGLAKADGETTTSADLSHSPTITSDHTRDGVILGTASYMSPEQARGKVVDKRTDIWAFGCVLYEMLTGRMAFPGDTVSDTIGAILHSEPDWSALPASLPMRARELLKRCLTKDSRQRLRDIGDARYELESRPDAGLVVPSAAPPPSVRLPWAVAGVAIVGALAALGWTMRPASHGGDAAPLVSAAVRITNTPAEEFGPAIAPDGKWVAYYSNINGRSDLLVKYLDNGSTLNLTASLNLELPVRTGIGGVAISPDGSQIAFGARVDPTNPQYDTWVMPGPVGGTPRKLLATIPSVQWSPDGTLLAYTVPGSTRGDALAICASDGTGERVLVEREGGRHVHWPAWSRDGQFIYFIYTYDTWHVEPSEIYRVPVKGGPVEPVVRSVRRAVYPVPLPSGDLLFSGNPNSLELGLWWRRSGTTDAVPLTNGLGEHTESRLSADGRRVISTLITKRASLVALPANGGAAQKLTDGYGNDLFPSVDFQSGRIAFSSARGGHRNLWVTKPDGSDPTPLTTETSIDDRPAFSPDGQQIAFVSDRGGQQGIWLINAQGGAPRLVAHEIVLDTLSWSPDGQRIFFARPSANLPGLASVSVNGGTVEAFKTPTEGAFAPGWAPNGESLAYIEPAMVNVSPPATTLVTRMRLRFADAAGHALFPETATSSANFSNGFLAWSPDRKRVAVASVSANGAAQIWTVEPGSAQPFRKLVDLPTAIRPRGMTWSKDGDRVIYAAEEFNGDIVMYDLK
jgi:eukaryotic-like serine/threonine-protein kinase